MKVKRIKDKSGTSYKIVDKSKPVWEQVAGTNYIKNKGRMEIGILSVSKKHRGKGIASKMLDEIIKDQRKEKKDLYVKPKPVDKSTTKKGLENLYRKKGFKKTKSGYMIRKY